jgi:hypothetical protein
MRERTVLSLSFDQENLHRRADLLKYSGFDVISVYSPTQARFEIEMGQCGIFISCALVPDVVNADLFGLFKRFCPDGVVVHVTSSRSQMHPTAQPHADFEVDEASGPEGIMEALLRYLKPHEGVA